MTGKTLFLLLVIPCALILLLIIASVVAAELLLYYTSNGHADLSFAIKKTASSETEIRKGEIRHRDKEWLKNMQTEEFFIQSAEGFKLRALYLPAPESNRIALCLHGIQSYGEREFATPARYFYENGISSLIIDQRGCGKSEGKYVTYGAKETDDAKRWIDFIVSEFGPDIRIMVCGSSMGAAVTLLLNNYELPSNVEYLIADCGYANAKDQLKYTMKSLKFPAGPCYFLYKIACKIHRVYNPEQVDVAAAVSKCTRPILLIHGDADTVVPTDNAYKLADACGDIPHKLIITEGLGHTQSLFLSEEALKACIDLPDILSE